MTKSTNPPKEVHKSADNSCPNCGSELLSGFKFCASCGQARIKDDSFKAFLDQFLNDYFTFDSNIFRSLSPLMTKPGFLLEEYMRGRRVSYIPPLRIFIFSSILFFLLFSLKSAGSIDTGKEIDIFLNSILPKALFVFVPLFALLIKWFFGSKGSSFTTHLLFSTYLHSFLFIAGIIYWVISRIMLAFDLIVVNQILFGTIILYFLWYLFAGLKRIYHKNTTTTFLKLIVIGFIYLVILSVLSLGILSLIIGFESN